MKCKFCSNTVQQGRVDLGFIQCIQCAEKGLGVAATKKGVMIWNHKTAPEMQTLSGDQHENFKRYNPYGKNTGRGSGLHKMSRKLVV